jgi:predicted AAA+ superfamily ATPase
MLQQGLSESLAGRFELIPMLHWSFSEMQEAFDVTEDEFAWFGGYPGAASLIKDERRWKDYILNSILEPSISRDILMLTRVDKPALLRQTFELGCIYSGQQLSFTKMIGQLQDAGNTTTLAHYLTLLSSAGLLAGLQKYSGAPVNTRNSSPKLQVYNNALISAYNGDGIAVVKNNPAQWGRWVENIIGTHLLNHSAKGDFELYYWRHVNHEIDFILKKGSKLIALEVKSGHTLRNSGIQAAKKQFTFYKTLLVGIEGLYWKDFIKINPANLFL